ncbi:pyridoxine 5'-phosphate oxidase C-terminal domain-containing protein, partial [Streptomyces sp. NPDC058308]|uniref:pyridoxine 5'-phosphate oxidase C-terminal domain-containing protein n=1 Tax=Streptomyces sp. NPDC058308 TaxID=3346440 RepID=UPI0036E2B366
QSEPLRDLDHAEELRTQALELAALQRPLPCPTAFAGYRLRPASVEFWANGTDRLHERLRYDRTPTGWHPTRLQP